MTRIDKLGQTEDRDGYVVRLPCVTDALGLTLTAAFASPMELPSDMQRALDALDRRGRN